MGKSMAIFVIGQNWLCLLYRKNFCQYLNPQGFSLWGQTKLLLASLQRRITSFYRKIASCVPFTGEIVNPSSHEAVSQLCSSAKEMSAEVSNSKHHTPFEACSCLIANNPLPPGPLFIFWSAWATIAGCWPSHSAANEIPLCWGCVCHVVVQSSVPELQSRREARNQLIAPMISCPTHTPTYAHYSCSSYPDPNTSRKG